MKFQQAAKCTNKVYQVLKKLDFGGTSYPGKLLAKFYPKFMREAQNYVTSYKFAITGTNGKTTTSGLLATILKNAEKTVVHNELGANMPNGILTSLALGLNENFVKFGANSCVDNFVIEVDEAYFARVNKQLQFDYLLVTNLFRDQLDRYGEMEATKNKIKEGIAQNPNLKLILNADDASLCGIDDIEGMPEIKKIYWGFDKIEFVDYDSRTSSSAEVVYCPKCNEPLDYKKRFYSQLGHWHCKCGVERPVADVSADVKVFKNYSFLTIRYEGKTLMFKLSLGGLYNAYNALGAIACALVAGVDRKAIATALENYRPAFGRAETTMVNGREVTFYLIKNPVGATEVLRSVRHLKNAKLLISINDNYADGRDVSWLWDTDFEVLANFPNKIYITGNRADDMALRLKYAGFNPSNMVIDNDIKKTFYYALDEVDCNEQLVVMPSYTSLLTINKMIKSRPKS